MTHRVKPAGPHADPFLKHLSQHLLPLDRWGTFRPGAKPAAVTAILYRIAGNWHLPFVVRRADLPSHPGQVGLPGGLVRADEGAWEAALREAEEEIGVPARNVVPLGAGLTMYAAVTNFSVASFVAYLPIEGVRFVPDSRELTAVLEVPLLDLLAEKGWLESEPPFLGRYFPVGDTRIWGLTARVLSDLLPRFSDALRAAGG